MRRVYRLITAGVLLAFLIVYNSQTIIPGSVESFMNPVITHTQWHMPEQHVLERHISWAFYVYAEPDFMSERLDNLPPQTVNVLEQRGNWILIPIEIGSAWIYAASDRLYTGRPMFIYDEIGGSVVCTISPQVVRILQRRDDWAQIDTWLGYGWLNFSFVPPKEELVNFVGQFGNSVSVFYRNLATGFTFTHNADRAYFGASATKAPFALYIYQKAERGETSLDSVHTFTAADYWDGSGIIRHRYNFGAQFTQRELLHLMITPSDNIATRILRRIHGLNGYRQFIEDIGGTPRFVQNLTYSYLSANEAGLIMTKIYRYIMSEDARYAHEFKENLLGNRYPFIISNHPVASKSGWAANFGGAWHDMAIVFAPSPYVLAILSDRDGNSADRRVYNAISLFIEEFNDKWFLAAN